MLFNLWSNPTWSHFCDKLSLFSAFLYITLHWKLVLRFADVSHIRPFLFVLRIELWPCKTFWPKRLQPMEFRNFSLFNVNENCSVLFFIKHCYSTSAKFVINFTTYYYSSLSTRVVIFAICSYLLVALFVCRGCSELPHDEYFSQSLCVSPE